MAREKTLTLDSGLAAVVNDADIVVVGSGIAPSADGTTALRFTKTDGTTDCLVLDTTNKRLRVGGTGAPEATLHIDGPWLLSAGADRTVGIAQSAGAGNRLRIVGPAGLSDGAGGAIDIAAGNGQGTGVGGNLSLVSGEGGATSGHGGDLSIYAGGTSGTAVRAGNIMIGAGETTGAGHAGDVTISAGQSLGGGDHGDVWLMTSNGGDGGGKIGNINIVAGMPTDGFLDDPGNIVLQTGRYVIVGENTQPTSTLMFQTAYLSEGSPIYRGIRHNGATLTMEYTDSTGAWKAMGSGGGETAVTLTHPFVGGTQSTNLSSATPKIVGCTYYVVPGTVPTSVKFKAILETTNAANHAAIQIYDKNGITGTVGLIASSALISHSTTSEYVEADITAALSGISVAGILEARLWIDGPVTEYATCTMAKIDVV